MKVCTIVGARPQFIKMALVSRNLRKFAEEIIINTDQHYAYAMNELFFKELNLPVPHYHLNVRSGTHGYQTAEMLKKIERILVKEGPDVVLVYGDTNTTLAGALAAVKLHIKIAHIEAGLRSFDRKMPEETNRVVTDLCSDLLFAPTVTAIHNLKTEGINEGVYLTGDVMYDVFLQTIQRIQNEITILKTNHLAPKGYILATIHRAENTDIKQNLQKIVNAFVNSGETIVFPLHPRTRKSLEGYHLLKKLEKSGHIVLIEPVGFLDMLVLEKNAKKIVTDSGGVQKEAYFLKIPCITLRKTTEWVETVEDGANILVNSNEKEITSAIMHFNNDAAQYSPRFGEGNASEKVCDIIQAYTDNL